MILRRLLTTVAVAAGLVLAPTADASPVVMYTGTITGTVTYHHLDRWESRDGSITTDATDASLAFHTDLGFVDFEAGGAVATGVHTTVPSGQMTEVLSGPDGSGSCSGDEIEHIVPGDLVGVADGEDTVLHVDALQSADVVGRSCDGVLAGGEGTARVQTIGDGVGDGALGDVAVIPQADIGAPVIELDLGRTTGSGERCPGWGDTLTAECSVTWSGHLRLEHVGTDDGSTDPGAGAGAGAGAGGMTPIPPSHPTTPAGPPPAPPATTPKLGGGVAGPVTRPRPVLPRPKKPACRATAKKKTKLKTAACAKKKAKPKRRKRRGR